MSDFPKEQIELMQAIYDMRMAQNSYFRTPTKVLLSTAKAKETKVDKYIEYFVVNRLIDTHKVTEQAKEVQASLFDLK